MFAMIIVGYKELQEESERRNAPSWLLVSKVIYQSQGIILPFIRLSEPYFYQTLWRKFVKREAKGQSGIEEKDDEEIAPIFTFLTSSLNVELVYIILESITQFSFLNSD